MAENDERRELTSWKEIAQFLGVGVRTAQRYESEHGLPVRRLGGSKGSAVVAIVADLNEWKRKHVTPRWSQDPKFLRRYAAVATALIVILGSLAAKDLFKYLAIGKPHHSIWLDAALIVSDKNGLEVWRKDFDAVPAADSVTERQHRDLNNDGEIETVVPYVSYQRDAKGGFLVCFSERGKELWRLEPRRAVSDRKVKYSTVYVLRSYQVFPSPEKDGSFWVAATFAHHYEYPSVAVVVDGNGKKRGEYWHSGHLDRVFAHDLNNDGREELLFAGMDRGTAKAVIRVFDPLFVSGASVLPAGHQHQLQGFEPGTERDVIHFERTRLNKIRDQFNYAYWIGPSTSQERSFQVYVKESLGEKGGYLIYTIAPDLKLASVVPSVSLQNDYVEYGSKGSAFKSFSEEDIALLRRGYVVEQRLRHTSAAMSK